MSRNYMSIDDELRRGDYLLSNNRQWKAIFQDDGNFVIYGWNPVWASDTWDSDAVRLCLQEDSNLVMYDKSDTARWASDSYKPGVHKSHVQLTDDGKLVLYRNSEEVWTSANSKGSKK